MKAKIFCKRWLGVESVYADRDRCIALLARILNLSPQEIGSWGGELEQMPSQFERRLEIVDAIRTQLDTVDRLGILQLFLELKDN